MEGKYDNDRFIIIGAGTTGCSTAYHLARRGKRVLVIDKGQIASGTTSRSTALVRTHYSNEIVARMALYSLRVFQNTNENADFRFVNSGLLIVAAHKHRAGMTENVKMLDQVGVKTLILAKSDVSKRFPYLDIQDCDFFLYEPESGYADPSGTANAYANKARELGVQFLLGKEAVRLNVESGSVRSVGVSNGTNISCSKVLLCSNVWTNRVLSNSRINHRELLPFWSSGERTVVLRRSRNLHGKHAIIWDYPNRCYYKPDGQVLMLVGSLDTPNEKYSDPDLCPSEVPQDYIEHLSEVLIRRIPSMTEGEFQSSYVGMYDVTPDGHPIIDELASIGLAGVFCCVGLSGHGFKLCPAYGVMNSEMLCGVEEQDQTFPISEFSFSRFKTGKEFRTKFADLATVA